MKGKKTGGRHKGQPNKITTTVKELTLKVLGNLGGEEAYTAWAKKNPTQFFLIVAKLIPHEAVVSAEIRMPLTPVDELHEH